MRRVVFFTLLAAVAGIAWAQPKIAVLDAAVPNNIDQSVVIPVTEKIIERLVISGRYTVLDRANVDKVLKEREFQVSGMVSDAEITEAGKYLGADFVVVAKVQRVSDTYFLSAKMIAVKTGVIANQSSAENEGKLSVLIKLAERVGDVLSGGTVLAPAAAEPPKSDQPPPPPPAAPAPAKAPPRPASSRDDRIGLRLYAGFGGGTQDLSVDAGDFGPFDASGVEVYALLGLGLIKHLCLVANMSYLTATDAYIYDSYYGDVYGAEFTSLDLGVGYVQMIGPVMLWAALKIGYVASYWDPVDRSGTEFAGDIGADFRLGDFLIGLRYQLQAADSVASDTSYSDMSSVHNAFWIMGGYRF